MIFKILMIQKPHLSFVSFSVFENCPALTAPDNGNILRTQQPPSRTTTTVVGNNQLAPGTKVYFECDDGYTMVGRGNATCMTTGAWDRPLPVCKGTNKLSPN